MCIEKVNKAPLVFYVTIVVVVLLYLSGQIVCVDDEALLNQTNDPRAVQDLTNKIFSSFINVDEVLAGYVTSNFGFCVKDFEEDWSGAFDFSSDLKFLSSCVRETKGDLVHRMCTAADIIFYFSSLFKGGSMKTNYLRPNKNCNLTSWVPGCEPGWACRVAKDEKVDIRTSKDMPARTLDCSPCCEGFFCPQGITCMIPCPLGSYCPLAKLNKTTGLCDPYHYQPPAGRPNHTCGGANIWTDFLRNREIFCSAGSYCPSTTRKIPCSPGHYCRAGSTSQTGCFSLANCKQETANQNITAYGIMLFAALTLLLLIIYNCSDQVLTTREKRQAKSRERGAKSARETVESHERWKSAKDVARKHAIGLQTQISRTFSRKKSVSKLDKLKSLGEAKPGKDASLPPMSTSVSRSKEKDKEQSNLTKMMRELEENPEGHDGFHLEIGDKNLKKNMPRGKQLHTRTQIFKYAYDQIEKEKALQEQNKNLTFSGVISMASDTGIRNRPTIEVDFKDLTLTLKGKDKHLLRSVTGKLIPGHISAVMGPSGAGKTTFLSALTGKATGCTIRGKILINGKTEPIQSYKKIIGFVPQDDVVHGNLTVEENLWFSASCRLSADLPIAEKVLVVERVIECLGLHPVRDSLVGTVERRGISGGQRKRVNVGLEMVMEPSLLILDEPTSGLDSSSSLLLLRALRREALEGVNICMVVHQPSYTLYKMFDDLILLAKGGLTVYHGSVKKVEEYFAGIGINVPERVNPPDHFIDILEGIVKPSPSSDVKYNDLPLRWMLHNGYPVPPDMLNSSGLSAASSPGENLAYSTDPIAAGSDGQSFVADLWRDAKSVFELKRDHIEHNILMSKDLSNRVTPSVFLQYRYFLGRVGKQRLRDARIQAVDFLLLLLAGICLGILARVSDETFGALGYTYTVIAVSLLVKIAALRSFSLDKLHYWRESASGMSSLAYFLAKDTVDNFNALIKPVVYLSMFYYFNNPRSSFLDNYIVLVCLVYCVTGIAYLFAIYLEPGAAQLWSVLIPVVLTLVAHQKTKGETMKEIEKVCYPKWAIEAFVIANAERYSGVWLITRCGALMKSNYDLINWQFCLVVLILYGIVCRAAAFLCLVVFQRK
ncbi:ABC transporter G family member 28 [Cornus florida]|uniref:ABC transporter G family member 28 n=1 Tax=Cornus florida TaxID=4283 RepID=UPI0028A25E2D|nr:ABC transporter G family member 28 [Cornus florida]